MKFCAFIMAIVVLMLSGVHCMDSAPISNASDTKANIAKSTSSQEHSNADSCSPFCTCSCCSSCTHVITHIKVGPVIIAAQKLQTVDLPSSIIKVSLPIWQPPQLAC